MSDRKTTLRVSLRETHRRKERKRSEMEKTIQEAIEEEPTIEESSHISVNVIEERLFRKREIHLIGKVHKESDKQRAQELAEINSKNKMKVINGILVEA